MNVRPGAVISYQVINKSGTASFYPPLVPYGTRGGIFIEVNDLKKKHRPFAPQNILQRNFSFAGTMSRNLFWNEAGTRLISWLCAIVFAAVVICLVIPADVQTLTMICEITACVLAILWILSLTALSRRRLRDAGLGAKSYLWLLLPVIGWIVFIGMLCRKTAISEK